MTQHHRLRQLGAPVGSRSARSRCRPRCEELERRTLLSQMTDLAGALLAQRTAEARQSFYVYRNGDSASNHGFPSGFFGVTGNLTINTAAIDDPTSPTGTTTDPNRLDLTHGTVMALKFAPEAPGQYVGVNIEEPEDWGVTHAGRGYDLRGATQVLFDVRSPTPGGITVQIGVGQSMSRSIHVPQSAMYATMSLPLSTFGLSNLSNVHVLFMIETNDASAPRGGILLVDNIRFDPVPTSQQTVLSFPLSTQTFGAAPLQIPAPGRVPFPSDQVLRNLTTTYESATTLFALLRPGASANDLAQAREIADTFVYALGHDNHGDPLPTAPDGSAGLHNGYSGGDVALFNNQPAPKLGRQGDVRLAGFSASTQITPSGFLLLLDGATGGNDAFAIMALSAAYRQFRDPRYLAAAEQVGRWVVGNLTDRTGAGYGGYYLGYPDQGAAKTLQKGKSVENNADIFAAFSTLAATEQSLGHVSQAGSWTSSANIAGDFVMSMYDPAKGRFNAGTVPAGTTGPGIDPSGPRKGSDVINRFDFLDSDSFTTLALAGSPRYRNAIDWRLPVQYVLSHFAQSVTAGGKTYLGFDIVALPTSGPNGIAWEFTGQAVELMRFVDSLYGDTRFEAVANAYLAQIRQAQATAPFHDGAGVVASTVQGGDTLPPIQQALSTPFQNIPERVGLAATTWAVFADQSINPFLNLALASTPATITATAGTPQSATVGAAFAARLQATVKDRFGNPLAGVAVLFAAPASGASGVFGGSRTVAVTTDAAGHATAPAFTANKVASGYVVTATAGGLASAASFSLTNKTGRIATIKATAGTSQSAAVGAAVAAGLPTEVWQRFATKWVIDPRALPSRR